MSTVPKLADVPDELLEVARRLDNEPRGETLEWLNAKLRRCAQAVAEQSHQVPAVSGANLPERYRALLREVYEHLVLPLGLDDNLVDYVDGATIKGGALAAAQGALRKLRALVFNACVQWEREPDASELEVASFWARRDIDETPDSDLRELKLIQWPRLVYNAAENLMDERRRRYLEPTKRDDTCGLCGGSGIFDPGDGDPIPCRHPKGKTT